MKQTQTQAALVAAGLVEDFTRDAMYRLLAIIDVDPTHDDALDRLTPLAPVWAAMISAAAATFCAAAQSGNVTGFRRDE